MKVYTNDKLSHLTADEVQQFDDISIIFDNASPSYLDLIGIHLHAIQKVERKEWKSSCMKIETIAKVAGLTLNSRILCYE